MMKNNIKRSMAVGLSCLTVLIAGCERFLEIDPPKSAISKEALFLDEGTAIGALKGVYRTIYSGFTGFASGNAGSVTINSALSADELLFINNFGLASPYEEISNNDIS